MIQVQCKYDMIQIQYNCSTSKKGRIQYTAIQYNEIHPQIQLKQKGNSEGWGGESFGGR